MDRQTVTPKELAQIMRHRAVNVAPLSDLTAMQRYADWLDEMPGFVPLQLPPERTPNTD